MFSKVENTVFSKTSTRIFCITGEIDDIFITKDLQIRRFDELLNGHLHYVGYDAVIFFSSDEMYSLDNDSANIMNNITDEEKRIDRNITDNSRNNKIEFRKKIKSTSDKLNTIDSGMVNKNHKKAFVITSLNDWIQYSFDDVASKGEVRNNSKRIFNNYCEKWKSLYDNDNILIFLAPELDEKRIAFLLNGDDGKMIKNEFPAISTAMFNVDSSINRESFIGVGCPREDEIRNLLQYFHIIGYHLDTNICRIYYDWSEKEYDDMIRNIMYYTRKLGIVKLKTLYELFCNYILKQDKTYVFVNKDIVVTDILMAKLEASPEERLKNTKGWKDAYEAINRCVESYKLKQKIYNYGNKKQDLIEENNKFSIRVDRLEPHVAIIAEDKVPSFVLQGPPGVGKSEIAGLIGRFFQEKGILKSGHTVRARKDDMVSQYIGGTAIKTANLIEKAQEGVLFVDEVYSLVDNDSSGSSNYNKEAINTLVAAMTEKGNRMCVVFAGYESKMDGIWKMNEGLASRFSDSNIITIKEYKPEMLKEIFQSFLEEKKDGIKFELLKEDLIITDNDGKLITRTSIKTKDDNGIVSSDEKKEGKSDKGDDLDLFFKNFYDLRDRREFGNARDVKNLFEQVTRSALSFYFNPKNKMELEPDNNGYRKIEIAREDFEKRKSLFEKRGINANDIFEEYVGLGWVKKLCDEIYYIKEEYESKNIEFPGPSHMIWVGNPGCGKSTAAKGLAKYYHDKGILGASEPIYIDAADLIGRYIGETQDKVKKILDEARDKNAVLIIEEAYQLADTPDFGKNAIDAMMNRMEDERNCYNIVFIVYEKNYKDFLKLNSGLASRVKTIRIPDYDEKQLFKIFKFMAKKTRDDIEKLENDIKELLKKVAARENNGNARTVRKLLDLMRANRALRKAGKIDEDWSFETGDIPSIEDLYEEK